VPNLPLRRRAVLTELRARIDSLITKLNADAIPSDPAATVPTARPHAAPRKRSRICSSRIALRAGEVVREWAKADAFLLVERVHRHRWS
jgi:hypothetical protein